MLVLLSILDTLLNSEQIIQVGGITLLLVIVFLETGIFFGFFLPGDYLLFVAGMLCGTEHLNYPISAVSTGIVLAAIIGNYTGYAFGRSVGERIFKKQDSLFFKKKYLLSSEEYFLKYGSKALIIGRFLPIVRTFAPILAGMHNMNLGKFSLYNISGAILWGYTLTLLGYYLGHTFPQIIDYLHWIILGFIGLTTLVVIKGFFKIRSDNRKRREANRLV